MTLKNRIKKSTESVIGNWENDNVTTIRVGADERGYFITKRQLANALKRMEARPSAQLRFVAVQGAKLDLHEFEVRDA